jgi:hypothetical protein
MASLTSRNLGCSTIDSQRLIRNSRAGIIRHTVGVRSFEKVCCTFDGSWYNTRGGRGGEGHERHERKQGRTLNTSWITDSRSQSFFVNWKSAYCRSFGKGGTFSLASARRTNWSTPYMLSKKDKKRELRRLTFRNFKSLSINLYNDAHRVRIQRRSSSGLRPT